MNSSHDNWNKLMGISGGCSLNSSISKKRIGLKTGGSARSKHLEGGQPKKELFGKSAKRVGTMIESSKKEKMMADGGPSKEHVYKIGSSSKTGGFENLGRTMKNDGGRAFTKITPGDMPRKKMGENGAGRQKALNGGDIKNAAMKAKAGAEEVGRKIKGGFEDFGNKFRSAFHFQEGGNVPQKMSVALKQTPEEMERYKTAGAKARAMQVGRHFADGGDTGCKKKK